MINSGVLVIRSRRSWLLLMSGLVAVFSLFHWSALALGSDRGQAGIIVGVIVLAALSSIQRFWFTATFHHAARSIALAPPAGAGLLVPALISALLLAVVPLYLTPSVGHVTMAARW